MLRRRATDRIFYTNLWFRNGHNNTRYQSLFPRLSRVDFLLIQCPGSGLIRALCYRVLRRLMPLVYFVLFARANRKYSRMFCTDPRLIRRFRGQVVVDVDDPKFTSEEFADLARSNVAAVIVTADSTRERLVEGNVTAPIYVVPQGIEVPGPMSTEQRLPRSSAGFVSSYLHSATRERGRVDPLYDVDHLLDELWPLIIARCPQAHLVLVGVPSRAVRRAVRSLPNVQLTGGVRRAEVLPLIHEFTVALYPRRVDQQHRAVKISEYLGVGVPVVTYDVEDARLVQELGGGVTVSSPRAFVEATVSLLEHPLTNVERVERADRIERLLGWDRLSEVVQRVLDEHLPRGSET